MAQHNFSYWPRDRCSVNPVALWACNANVHEVHAFPHARGDHVYAYRWLLPVWMTLSIARQPLVFGVLAQMKARKGMGRGCRLHEHARYSFLSSRVLGCSCWASCQCQAKLVNSWEGDGALLPSPLPVNPAHTLTATCKTIGYNLKRRYAILTFPGTDCTCHVEGSSRCSC